MGEVITEKEHSEIRDKIIRLEDTLKRAVKYWRTVRVRYDK